MTTAAIIGALGLAWAAVSAAAGDRVPAQLEEIERLLDEQQIESAVERCQALYAAYPDVAPVQLMAGKIKFYQGDYQGAVTLLERGVTAYGGDASTTPLLEMSRAARELTRDDVSVETAHFVVRTPPGKDQLLSLYAGDALEAAIDRLSKIFDYRPARKIVVEVLPSPKALARVSPLTEEAIKTSGTVALSKYGRLIITSPKALFRGYSWLDTLAHELVHLLVAERTRNNVPVWLQEGLAKYYEAAWRDGAGQSLDPGSERLLAAAVKKRKLITFAQMHPSLAMLPTQHDTALAFAEVFTVVELLQQRKGDAVVAEILGRVGDGDSVDAAVARAWGSSFQRFERDWRAYLESRAYQVVPGAEPRKLVFKRRGERDDLERDGGVETLDPKAARWYRLGDLLHGAGRPRAAAVEYQRAVDLVGVRYPELLNRLGATYFEAGDLDRARASLEAALSPAPENPRTHILLGRIALAQQRWADARQNYELANREHPFHPEIHASLLAVARASGDKALEEREQKALRYLTRQAVEDATGHGAVVARDDPEAGLLTLETRPFVRVIIDGDDLGLWTPLVELPLRAGSHKLQLLNSALGIRHELEVTIEAGKATSLSQDLFGPT